MSTLLNLLQILILVGTINCIDNTQTAGGPVLSFFPKPPKKWEEQTLIWYKGGENYKSWSNKLNKFLQVYDMAELTPGRQLNIYNCDFDDFPPKGRVCRIDLKQGWGPCTKENIYSYHKHSPCVFLRLDAPKNWIPDYLNISSELPTHAHQDLREYINKADSNQRKMIWVSCDGEGPLDRENIGPVKYYPRPGFPGYFFPAHKAQGYLSPIVAVHFEKPTRGVITNVVCQVYAGNIENDLSKNIGAVHFELLVDD
uniref:CSON009503 protein n=1 Tax=Culicoides sonorensis TaxID=179676 RepID=A0A336M073_CULSO